MSIQGVQMPSIWCSPGPVVGTLGEEARDLASVAGLDLDEWQAWTLIQASSVNPNDTYWNKYTKRQEAKWAALEVMEIVARQNGKGSILEARELAGLFLWGERVMIHTAHRFDTANKAFERVATLIDDTPSLSKHLKAQGGILHTSGRQGIYLKSGQELVFKTRTGAGARGLTADWLCYDECMYLDAEEVSASMPTLASRPNAQLWMTGSAGDQEVGDCSEMGRTRQRAIVGGEDAEGLFFAEWSPNICNEFCPKPDTHGGGFRFKCTVHDDPSKPETWAKANPGQAIRISERYIAAEMRKMGGPGSKSWQRERLSIGNYPIEGEAWKIIPKDSWEVRTNSFAQMEGPYVLGIDTTPDRSYTALVASGIAKDSGGMEQVEITSGEDEQGPFYDHKPGVDWVVARVLEIWNSKEAPYAVIVDAKSQAGSFIDELTLAKVNVVTLNGNEYAQGCGEFRSAVCPQQGETATLVHLGQPPLAIAVAQAEKRELEASWAWSKRSSTADISPLVAATLALWGRRHVAVPKKGDPWAFFGDEWMDDDDWNEEY